MKKLSLLLISCLLLAMFGCAKPIETERSAAYYRDLGDTLYIEGDYDKAAEAYENALLRAETPNEAARIQLALANSYYYDKSYKEAIPVYEVYLDIYTNTPQSARAYLNVGLSYYELKPSYKKDSTFIIKSRDYINNAIVRDPSLLTDDIQILLVAIQEELARKELAIATYYGMILKKEPRILRLIYISENYSDTQVYPKAAKQLVELLAKEGRVEEAVAYYEQLAIAHPNIKETSDAKEAIDKQLAKQ